MPPIPSGASYVSLISYPRILAVPPIPWRPPIHIYTIIPEGIGGAANIPRAPHTYLYFHIPWILAVAPIPWRPLIYISTFILMGIGGAANTLEAPHTCIYFYIGGYWRCRQYTSAPYTYLLFRTRGVLAVPPIPRRLIIRIHYKEMGPDMIDS